MNTLIVLRPCCAFRNLDPSYCSKEPRALLYSGERSGCLHKLHNLWTTLAGVSNGKSRNFPGLRGKYAHTTQGPRQLFKFTCPFRAKSAFISWCSASFEERSCTFVVDLTDKISLLALNTYNRNCVSNGNMICCRINQDVCGSKPSFLQKCTWSKGKSIETPYRSTRNETLRSKNWFSALSETTQ